MHFKVVAEGATLVGGSTKKVELLIDVEAGGRKC